MNHNRDEFTPVEIVELLGVQPATAPPTGLHPAGQLAARALGLIDEFRARHRLRRELEALSDGDIDRVLAEATLTRADIEPMLANHPASAHLLDAMAARLHIGDKLHDNDNRLAERDMWRVCTLCSHQGRCRHWLASGATEGFEKFCPNAERLEAMRDEA